MYKGYCRIPYPSTPFGDLTASSSYYGRATFSHGSNPVELSAGLDGGDTIITGNFVHKSDHESKKEKKIKHMLEKLVQRIVENKKHKTPPSPMILSPNINDDGSPKGLPNPKESKVKPNSGILYEVA